MGDAGRGWTVDRARLGWWSFAAVLAAIAAYVAYSFLGLLALGLAGYYGTRPLNRYIESVVGSDDVAAWATVVTVLLPVVLVAVYAGVRIYQQARAALSNGGTLGETLLDLIPETQREALTSLTANPGRLLGGPEAILGALGVVSTALFGGLLFLGLAVTLTAFLLANDRAIAAYFGEVVGGEDSVAWAYATAVDSDLESVFFGNVLFVAAMTAIAAVLYWLTNVVAPAGVAVPFPLVVAFLTGVTSLIPAVVSKVVYLPVVGYLAVQASQAGRGPLLFVAGVLVVYFFILDFLPQTFLQPYLSGRHLDTVMLMFGYLLGPVLIGWHGVLVLPIFFVLLLEALRIVVPELVHGDVLTPTVSAGASVGADPRTSTQEPPSEDEPDEADTAADGETSSVGSEDGAQEEA